MAHLVDAGGGNGALTARPSGCRHDRNQRHDRATDRVRGGSAGHAQLSSTVRCISRSHMVWKT
jgi:hypothetical protein